METSEGTKARERRESEALKDADAGRAVLLIPEWQTRGGLSDLPARLVQKGFDLGSPIGLRIDPTWRWFTFTQEKTFAWKASRLWKRLAGKREKRVEPGQRRPDCAEQRRAVPSMPARPVVLPDGTFGRRRGRRGRRWGS